MLLLIIEPNNSRNNKTVPRPPLENSVEYNQVQSPIVRVTYLHNVYMRRSHIKMATKGLASASPCAFGLNIGITVLGIAANVHAGPLGMS